MARLSLRRKTTMAVSRADSADFDCKPAGADLSTKLFFAAVLNSSGELVLAGDGAEVYGIITEASVQGRGTTVQKSGMTKAVCGAAINPGVKVMANSDGKLITATGAGKASIGIARSKTTSADQLVEIEIDRSRVPA
jgi:hypothetical protein